MNYQYLSNLPPDEALGQFLAGLDGWHCKTETVKTQEALGRVLAEGTYAALCSPHYNAAAMDGIALNTACTFGATETTPVTLLKSDYVVVDTGDPLPEDCDGVVMVEDVVDGENGTVTLYGAAVPWQNVRQIGEDICAGDLLLPSFSQLTPAALGALLAGGVLAVKVLKKPVVGIIPTGDEIVPPCQEPKKGDIIEFNSAIFSAMLTGWGAEPVTFPIVKDVREDIRGALRHALDTCDMVLLGAGSSAGREDFSSEVIGSLGKVVVHGVAMKPGKPAILGICDGKPVVGVPGYPVSGILVLEQFVRPLVDLQLGRPATLPQTVEATLARRVTSSLKYQEHIRVSLGSIGGKIVAVPLNRGAGVVTSFVKADGILEIPQNSEGYEAGERVQIRILRPLAQIQNTLPVIGSHDPLIDELA
ncbi:MAG: molybdopterin-binding protein, partial [Oscillospiraceae bacterium]